MAVVWGQCFHSHFLHYALTLVIFHSSFIVVEEHFFHFSIWSHQKQIKLWEVAGGMTHPQRSPCFAERGHHCPTFLLEFSIPEQCCLSVPPAHPLASLPSLLLLLAFPLLRTTPVVKGTFKTKFKARLTLVQHWWASWPPSVCYRHEA